MSVCDTFRYIPLHSDTGKTNALTSREEVLYLHLTKLRKLGYAWEPCLLHFQDPEQPAACRRRTQRRELRTPRCKFWEGSEGEKKKKNRAVPLRTSFPFYSMFT